MTLGEMTENTQSDPRIIDEKQSCYSKVYGYVKFVLGGGPDRPLYYLACQVCKKKVIDEQSGYRCENC